MSRTATSGRSQHEKRRLKISQLPANLSEALDYLEKDKVMQSALGYHIYEYFLDQKRQEWAEYSPTSTPRRPTATWPSTEAAGSGPG